jgi:hypothetical protein
MYQNILMLNANILLKLQNFINNALLSLKHIQISNSNIIYKQQTRQYTTHFGKILSDLQINSLNDSILVTTPRKNSTNFELIYFCIG